MKDTCLTFLSNSYEFFDRRAKLIVLTLHRIGKGFGEPAKTVVQHLEYLAMEYKVVFPSQVDINLLGRRTAIITIDDCHEDVYKLIFPIAKKLNIPLTLCVPTDFFFRCKWLWFDKILWGLEQAQPSKEIRVGNIVIQNGMSFQKRLLAHLKKLRADTRDEIIDKILKKSGVTLPKKPCKGFRPIRISDMREMLATGLVEIASHTVSHPILTTLTNGELEMELVQSKRELDEFCGRDVSSFCYPNGLQGDFDARTREALTKAGYKIAFTSIEGVNFSDNIDLIELKRIHLNRRLVVFRKMASGLGEFQRKVGVAMGRGERWKRKIIVPNTFEI